MSEEFKKTPSNVIKGPWGERPKAVEPDAPTNADEPVSSDMEDKSKVVAQLNDLTALLGERGTTISDLLRTVERDLVGVGDEFREIYNTALRSIPLESKVLEEMAKYSEWTREELMSFANKTQNHSSFKTKPALVIAVYRLLLRR